MSRSTRLLLAATAAAVGLAAAVPAAQAAPVAVLSPADDSLATGAVDVKVRLPAGATKVSARVAGTDVKLRGAGAIRTASIPVGKLEPGRTTLTLRATGKRGKRLVAHSHFVIGKPKPTLLDGAAKVTQGGGTAALKLNLRARPTQLRVKLNGKRVQVLSRPTSGATTVRLSAADGLRFGRNTVTLRAYDRRDGRWARVTRRFKMSRKAPLASAGRDVRVDAGAKVRLSAAGTKTRERQLPLSYSWRIVDQPRGANAKLSGATGKHPSIKTTRPGRYSVELRLRKRARRAHAAAAPLASDVVTVAAGASIPPYGAPLTTLVDNGNGTYRTTIKGIPLNGSDDFIDAADSDVTLIVLDQKTLGVISAQSGPLDAFGLGMAADQVGEDQIGIIVAPAGCCDWQGTLGPISTMNGGWSIVFSGDAGPGSPMAVNAGNVTVPGGKPGAISGVVRKSTELSSLQQTYTVVEPDVMGFDSSIPQGSGASMMALGPVWATHSGTGIGVLAVNADLATTGFNAFFPLTGDQTADAAQLGHLKDQLDAIAGQSGAVMMLQTYGKPKAATTAWGQVGESLAAFGGTPTVWDALDGSGDYALVGRAGAGSSGLLRESASTEASAPLTQANAGPSAKATAGTVRGFVGRGIDSLPVIAASTSLPTMASKDINGQPEMIGPFQMTGLASLPPQPWPATDAPGKQAALRWISEQLGLGDPTITLSGACYQPATWDVRAEYCDVTQKDNWGGNTGSMLAALTFPAGRSDFTADDFNAVVSQLKLEFPKIASVFNMIDGLESAIGDAQAKTVLDVNNAISDVDKSLSENQTKGSGYSMATFVSSLLDPLTQIVLPEDATDAPAFGLGLIESGIEQALDSVTDDDGNPALAAFDSDKDSIANDAVARLTASKTQLDLLEQIILSDWTKLATTAHYAPNAWGLNGLGEDLQTQVIEASTRTWLYKTALPIAYSQVAVTPSNGNTQAGMLQMTCKYDGGNGILYTRWPWIPGATPNIGSGAPTGGTPVPPSAVFAPATGTNADGSPVIGSVYGLGNAIDKESLQVPDASLTDLLFTPVTQQNSDGQAGIGLYPEQFYTWAWAGGNRFQFSDKRVQDGLANPEECFN